MYAERILLETDALGHLKQQPQLPPNKAVEALFLVLDGSGERTTRRPHPDIMGKVQVLGNVLDSVPAADWDPPARLISADTKFPLYLELDGKLLS